MLLCCCGIVSVLLVNPLSLSCIPSVCTVAVCVCVVLGMHVCFLVTLRATSGAGLRLLRP